MGLARKLGLMLAVALALVAIAAPLPAEAWGGGYAPARVFCGTQSPGMIWADAIASNDPAFTNYNTQYVRSRFQIWRYNGSQWLPYQVTNMYGGVETDATGWTKWFVDQVTGSQHLGGTDAWPIHTFITTADRGLYGVFAQYSWWWTTDGRTGYWYATTPKVETTSFKWYTDNIRNWVGGYRSCRVG